MRNNNGNSDSNSDNKSNSITHIVITASHELVAKVFDEQLSILKQQLSWLKHTEVLCVADPAGRRIGSGGGTLNAVNCLLQKYNKEVLQTSKIAIIHSGGDSQRAPLHTVCGKAWASINSSFAGKSNNNNNNGINGNDTNNTNDTCSSGYSTAFSLLLRQLFSIAAVMHPGTVIVSCSDVLLNLTSIEVCGCLYLYIVYTIYIYMYCHVN